MQSLIDTMNHIQQCTAAICDYVEANTPDFIQVTSLPQYTKDDELNSAIIHQSIEAIQSEQPVRDLCVALRKKYIDGNESGRILQRWTGVVAYQGSHEHLQSLISQLNEHKSDFKAIVDEYSDSVAANSSSDDSKQKFDFVHDFFPMLVTMYVYRKVHYEVGPISAAYWSWLRAPSSKNFTKDAYLAFLERQKASVQLSLDAQEQLMAIDATMHAVAQSITPLYVQRLTKPPRPNLLVHFADERKPRGIYGGLPVFLFNQGKIDFSYKPIKSFDASKLGNKRKRKDTKQLTHFKGDFYVPA
jgi:hypothetical protein